MKRIISYVVFGSFLLCVPSGLSAAEVNGGKTEVVKKGKKKKHIKKGGKKKSNLFYLAFGQRP